jgi:hypothetical protein
MFVFIGGFSILIFVVPAFFIKSSQLKNSPQKSKKLSKTAFESKQKAGLFREMRLNQTNWQVQTIIANRRPCA